MERWAAVIRVSHMGARVAGSDNVHADRDQVAEIERHARLHGAHVDVLPAELNVSGGLPLEHRPSLLAAIEGVERGEYHAIVVAYLSRLGRNIREQLRAWDRVEAAGGRIVVVRENIDSSTPSGRLQRTFLLGMAEHEREQHAERFEDLRRWATAAGVWQRRQTPLGYTRNPVSRRLVLSDDTEKVRRAFTDRVAGRATLDIARDLGMTTSGVRALLANRVYLGELRVGSHVNATAHPPLIDAETWHQAQAARVTRPLRVREHPALLAGLVRCTGCGHAMSSSAQQKVVVYSCHRHHSAGACPAPAAITARLLDEHVNAIALDHLAHLRATASDDARPVNDARRALAAAEAELGAFLRGVNAAGLEPAQFADAARERRDTVDVARDAVSSALAGRPVLVDGNIAELWRSLDEGERNHVLGGLLEVVLVARAGGRGRIVPIETRVRVIRRGSGLVDLKRYRGAARPIVRVRLPDFDDPCVLRVLGAQDAL